jgi:hypothetical protein
MSNYRIEFAVVNNSDGGLVHLYDMNVEVAKSFMVFLDSLTKIAELQPIASDFKIKVTEGSACVAIEPPASDIEKFNNEVFAVLENKSINKDYVDLFKRMQTTIKANGLGYRVDIVKNRQRTPIIDLFKDNELFKITGKPRTRATHKLEFISGKLLEIGGKKPNFHVELDNNEIVTVKCTEEEAKKFDGLLYQKINLSVWRKITSKSDLHFCDFYLSDDIYSEFIEFITLNNTAIGTEKYNQIHSKIVDLISRYENNLGFVKKFIQLYNHESIDNGKLRTILITLKSFKDDPNIKSTMEDIAILLRKKSNKTSI